MKNGLVNGIFLEDLLIWQEARYIATQLCMRKQTKQIVFDIHIYLIDADMHTITNKYFAPKKHRGCQSLQLAEHKGLIVQM